MLTNVFPSIVIDEVKFLCLVMEFFEHEKQLGRSAKKADHYCLLNDYDCAKSVEQTERYQGK
ncbi:hypothetical protein DO97_04905 [Neosynechococcus sphagnicola sy1]|uniref:Uncharacterized protein n=1 Tax=Neosynechococcus sphagnicola sy1 TaxID=1497020 RepID=A0A098TKJ3_9CYAN|nr:hypothetical protein DO97_04905 [Neosynechococcus sphagnicola sy1]